MSLQASFFKKTFHFSFQARTSRGSMTKKDSWFLKVWDAQNPESFGIGEAGPLPGLSLEKPEEVELQLTEVVSRISKINSVHQLESLHEIHDFFRSSTLSSSVLFALETAMLDLKNGGTRMIYQNNFLAGEPLPINGLIWMGGLDGGGSVVRSAVMWVRKLRRSPSIGSSWKSEEITPPSGEFAAVERALKRCFLADLAA